MINVLRKIKKKVLNVKRVKKLLKKEAFWKEV